MGLIIKKFKHNIGIESDKYIKIDSVRAGMGSNNKIDCCCTEWLNNTARANNQNFIKANTYYHIPDENIQGGTNLINSVYPLLKKYFQNQGYTVEDDNNVYTNIIENTVTTTKTNSLKVKRI